MTTPNNLSPEDELRNLCADIQISLEVTDDEWENIAGNREGLYGFIAQHTAKAYERGRVDEAKTCEKARKHDTSQIEKAYGGCHSCYGKGYATRQAFANGRTDIPQNPMVYCKCERGKQLESLSGKAVVAALKGYVKKDSAEWHRQKMIKYKASMEGMPQVQIMQANSLPASIPRMYRYHKSMYEHLRSQVEGKL